MATIQQPSTSTSSASPASQSQAPPTVNLIPASPIVSSYGALGAPIGSTSDDVDIDHHITSPTQREMRDEAPTDSQTALVGRGEPIGETDVSTEESAPIQTNRSSVEFPATSNASQDRVVIPNTQGSSTSHTSAPTTTPAPVASTSKPITTAPASSSAPQPTSNRTLTKPQKKKKRKGLAGFFAALGCISSNEFEEDGKPTVKPTTQMAQKPAAVPVTKPVIPAETASKPPPHTADPSVAAGVGAGVVAGAAVGAAVQSHNESSAVDHKSVGPVEVVQEKEEPQAEEVIVAPVEPVLLPEEETAGVTSSAVQPPGSGSALLSTPPHPHPSRRSSEASIHPSPDSDRTDAVPGYTDTNESDVQSGQQMDEHEYGMEEEYEDEEDRLIAQGGMGIPLDENGQPAPLLPIMDKVHQGRKCLVLDLDETLLHSSFKMLPSADFIVPVEIESQTHNVYVMKRPGADHFLEEMGKHYEVVVFTASLSKYADPVLDILDIHHVVRHRLFRESCYNHKGNYVKDLSQLGRDMETTIIIDNSPASYIFHPTNAVPVSTWFNDPHDTELTDLCPFLVDLATVDDIRGVLDGSI